MKRKLQTKPDMHAPRGLHPHRSEFTGWKECLRGAMRWISGWPHIAAWQKKEFLDRVGSNYLFRRRITQKRAELSRNL